jgi:hypothetical protein
MTNHRASLFVALFFTTGSLAVFGQARPFTGRLISRELVITSNCSAVDPPRQVLGQGLSLPRPKLPDCDFVFPTGGNQKTAPVYSAFNIGFPEETPTGIMNASDSAATIEFSQPLTLSLTTNLGWLLNPPAGVAVGTHRANSAIEIEQQPGALATCVGTASSIETSGTLTLSSSCPIRSTLASWDPATLSAKQTIVATVTFRFGNGNGVYTVLVRGNYEYRALDVSRVEVLQTVGGGRVPLTAGRPALVRVFPSIPRGYSGGFQARLAVYRDDRLLQTVESATIPTTAGSGLELTANFVLPPALTAGGGTLRLDPSIRLTGSEAYISGRPVEAVFQAPPNWPDPFSLLHLCPAQACTQSEVQAGLRSFEAMAPWIATTKTAYLAEGPASRQLQIRSVGPSTAVTAAEGGATVPCLIGSALGLERKAAITGDLGLAPSFDTLIPADTAEFMTCEPSVTPVWISAANTLSLFDAFQTRPALSPSFSAATVITGSIAAGGGSATIDPPLNLTSNQPPQESRGNLCLRLFARGIQTGTDQCLDRGPSADAETPFSFILSSFPGDVDRIALFLGDQQLASLTRSATAPSIQINSRPTNATDRNLRMSWTVTDPDNDTLLHDLWWSSDNGASWLPLSLNLSGTEANIDTARFSPAERVLIRIRASDGFNETLETVGPISLDARPALDPIAPVRLPDALVNEGRIIRIPVRNSGAGTLRVSAVSSTSAALLYTGSPFSIAAGETTELPLLFQPSNVGSFTASVALRSNDPARPAVEIPLEGAVYRQRGPAAMLSSLALDFGSATGTSDRALRITNGGNAPLNIANISTGATQVFRLTGANSLSIVPGATGEIQLRCTPSSSNYAAGTLTASTNDPVLPALNVALGCEGSSSALEVPAVTVDFGTVAGGQVRAQFVTIRNASAVPITITGAVFTNAQFRLANPRLPFVIPASNSANLELQFAPTVAGVATSTLALNTDNPAISAQITMRGVGTASSQSNGRLEVQPNQLAFGEVIVNQSRTLTLSLRNSGTGQLTITSLASNNPAFVVTNPALPLAILPGSPLEIQVRFAPSSATAYNSVLTISSDSVSGSDVFLSLTGIGLPIPATTLLNLSAPLRQDWPGRATLVSYGPDEANLRLVRYDINGTQANDTGLTIPPGTQLLPNLDAGSGWTQARIAKGYLEGYVEYSGQQGQTFDVIPFSPANSTRLILTGLEPGSDLVLNNLASEPNAVSLELRGNNAAGLGTQTLSLQSRGTLTQRIEQIFTVPQGFQGYLLITAAQPLLATRTNNGATAMELSQAQPAPAVATRNMVLYAPRIQAGNGWLARLQIVNPTDQDARVTIRSASSGGVSIGTPIVETIPPGRAYWREFTQMFNLDGNITWNASLAIESNLSGVVAEVSYGNSFSRAAYALTDTAARRASIPANNPSTTLYIFNPNSAATSVNILNLLEGGSYGTGRRITIPAGGYYGGPSGLQASPAIRIESEAAVVAHASIQASQVTDFGILPAVNLDTALGGNPPAGATPRLQVDPPSLDFGNVIVGQSKVLALSIRNGGTATLTVNSIASSSGRYNVEGALPVTIAPGSTQQVQVRFTPAPATSGPQTGTLTVSSNDSLTGPVTISLTGIGATSEVPRVRIDVTPSTLDYGEVTSGQTKDLALQIRNLGTDPLVVTAATLSNSRFQLVSASFPLTVTPSGLAILQIRFAPATAGLQAGTLTIASNDSANPSVNVALRGVGSGTAASPRIVVSASSLEFGPVRTGQLAELTFEIRNTGVAPLVIQAMTVDGFSYSVGPAAPFTIAPNAIADVGVNFRPRDVGPQPATLRIVSNDPVNGTIVIPITGSGQ